MHLTFFGEVCFSLLHVVRFRRWVRLTILGQATIEALETPNPSDARKCEIKSTKKHETHPSIDTLPGRFFSRLGMMFYAGDDIAQHTWERLLAIGRETTGRDVLLATSLGSTGTAPFALACTEVQMRSGNVGVPS